MTGVGNFWPIRPSRPFRDVPRETTAAEASRFLMFHVKHITEPRGVAWNSDLVSANVPP